ncbi:MAG: IS21-like element helper ATPase IstB [Desulfovibrio sp.]|jgi:DNA replication protein DnaC|nr:IS21-like element helper ATPase IstB [Desulfovibrio sp.]
MRLESEIGKLARKMNWPVVEQYKKHVKKEGSFEDNLLTLLRLENDRRDGELLKRRIKLAGFPILKTLDTFEFDSAKLPYLKQEQVLEIAVCDFIKDRTNVCAIGNSGTGKTHLMTAIGMEAIRKGYSVRFCRACDLAVRLSEAQSEKKLAGMLNALHKCALLCVDELGYMTLDQRSAQLLFQVLAGRYEVRSTMITSNLEFSKWPDFIGDPIMATALIDRLIHRSAILNMNGEGYRLRGAPAKK